MVDFVNHPPHYTAYKGLEIIDLTEQMNFNRGNAVKYVARAGLKDESLEKEIEDLKKAVWYIQREIERISQATVDEEVEPTCDICCVMERDADAWCGNCGSCLAHCLKHKGCARDISPFCPHYKNPDVHHLRNNCERTQIQLAYDLETFNIWQAKFIASRNVHMTPVEVIDEVRMMRDMGNKIAEFIISTFEVDDEG